MQEPNYTCPLIDSAIESSNEAISTLEEIRDSNEELRRYGNYWEQAYTEMEDERDILRDEVADLEKQISFLTREVESLQEELASV